MTERKGGKDMEAVQDPAYRSTVSSGGEAEESSLKSAGGQRKKAEKSHMSASDKGSVKSNASGRHFRALMFSMFKIGCIGFGGGSALIPVIEKEVVEEKKLVSKSEYNNNVVIACITPGALPVEIAAGLGHRIYGIPGMLLASMLMAVPGVFIMILILSILSGASGRVLDEIQTVSIGLGAFIISLLVMYAEKTLASASKHGKRRAFISLAIMLSVFALSCGDNLYNIFGIDFEPIFGLSTVQVLGIAFFGILFTQCHFTKKNTITSFVLITLYLLCTGGHHIIKSDLVHILVVLAMLYLSIRGFVRSFNNSRHVETKSLGLTVINRLKSVKSYKPTSERKLTSDLKPASERKLTSDLKPASGKKLTSDRSFMKLLRALGAWLVILVISIIPSLFVNRDAIVLALKGFVSTLMSFGGGDAYLSIADGMFVDPGMITQSEFYTRLIPVANVLPGSILCKILTGVGYYHGLNASGTVAGGIIVSVNGFITGVAASVMTFLAIYYIYDNFQGISVFRLVSKWIRPIISGLLLNVALSMAYQNVISAENLSLNVPFIIILTIVILALNIFLIIFRRTNNLLLIVISAVLGTAAIHASFFI
ncbi:MAG: chromate transporter [Lachnospiraceae bacterium]|jgi:chromate transporter|nr:chromate transporter [Lachnospiraceae bacterium]MEE3461339.1 chromate transporter [Lachnospiraceae bacterium]